MSLTHMISVYAGQFFTLLEELVRPQQLSIHHKEWWMILEKMHLLTFDPVHLGYLEIGKRVDNTFKDGTQLK